MTTEPDESLRKAYRQGCEDAAGEFVEDYIWLIRHRNQYARAAGYDHFYEMKTQTEERMRSQDVFDLFDSMYDELTATFGRMREVECQKPGVRDPWNMSYMMAGDIIRQEDQYFPLETALDVWGQSFTALGIQYRDCHLKLDLLQRKGKYDNGFCHWPVPAHRLSDGSIGGVQANFTCTAIPGEVGAGDSMLTTLFHEGGHAAHYANMQCQDIVLNTEYAPASVARAETQSMFLDTMCSSIEWKMRYARSLAGDDYPFELYEQQVHQLAPLAGRSMLWMASVVKFEETLYQTPDDELTPGYVLQLARELSTTYTDQTHESIRILAIPHIYSWSSSAYYHGYAMATLALYQLRAYLYETDGYIVDNPRVGPWLTSVREQGSLPHMDDMMQQLVGQGLSPHAYLQYISLTPKEKITHAQQRVQQTMDHGVTIDQVDLAATIELRDGQTLIGSSVDGREQMTDTWRAHLHQ